MRVKFAIAATLALIASMMPVAANAQNDPLNPDYSEVESQLLQNDVPEAQIDGLLLKLENGEEWDVFSESTPKSVEVFSLPNGITETISRFADGSYLVEGIQTPTPPPVLGSITPFGVSNCQTTSSGSGYTNGYDCQAYASTAQFALGFYISYSLLNGGYDSIIEVNSPYAQAYLGSITPNPPKLVLQKKKETSTGPAWANVRTQFNPVGTGGRTLELKALVGSNKAITQWGSQ